MDDDTLVRWQTPPDGGTELIHGWVCERPASVDALCEWLRNLHAQNRWIFRGEKCRFPDCKPGNARRHAHGSRIAQPGANDDDVALFIQQHYGERTPMVDWTRNPFVAMFFASDEQHVSDADGVDSNYARIWCFDWDGAFPALARQWDRLGDAVIRKPNMHVDISSLRRNGVRGWIVVVQLTTPVHRIQTQRAVVTIAGDDDTCHLSQLASLEPLAQDHRRVFEFPSVWKPRLRDLCRTEGICLASLGLESTQMPSVPCDASTITASNNYFGSL